MDTLGASTWKQSPQEKNHLSCHPHGNIPPLGCWATWRHSHLVPRDKSSSKLYKIKDTTDTQKSAFIRKHCIDNKGFFYIRGDCNISVFHMECYTDILPVTIGRVHCKHSEIPFDNGRLHCKIWWYVLSAYIPLYNVATVNFIWYLSIFGL